MQRFRKILVGVDGSDAGFHALSEAIRLSQWSRGSVTAATVMLSYEGDLSLVGVQDIQGLMTGACEEILSKAIAVAKSMNARIHIKCEAGKPDEQLAELAAAQSYDLLVLGSTRSPSTRGLLRAGMTTGVVRQTAVPVLIIPEHAPIGWEKMLLVSQTAADTAEETAQVAALAGLYGGQLEVLMSHRNQNPQFQQMLNQAVPIKYIDPEKGGGRKALTRRILQHKYQMVVIKRPERRFAWSGVGPLKEIIQNSPCPLLVLP